MERATGSCQVWEGKQGSTQQTDDFPLLSLEQGPLKLCSVHPRQPRSAAHSQETRAIPLHPKLASSHFLCSQEESEAPFSPLLLPPPKLIDPTPVSLHTPPLPAPHFSPSSHANLHYLCPCTLSLLSSIWGRKTAPKFLPMRTETEIRSNRGPNFLCTFASMPGTRGWGGVGGGVTSMRKIIKTGSTLVGHLRNNVKTLPGHYLLPSVLPLWIFFLSLSFIFLSQSQSS